MTRVSTYGTSQTLLAQVLQAQNNLNTNQQQITSGYQAETYSGLADNVQGLEAAKALKARTQSYLGSNDLVTNRVQAYDTSLQELGNIASQRQQGVANAVATGSGTALAAKVQDLYSQAVDVLNQQVDGRYIFAGSRTDTPPVTATTAAQLVAAPTVASVFANDQNPATAQLDGNRTITYGQLASNVATGLFTEFQRVLQFDAGTLPSGAGASAPAGAFNAPLPANQKGFLTGELAALDTTSRSVQDSVAANGVVAQTLAGIQAQQNSILNHATAVIGDLQDADTATAITKLNEDQTALQASYQVLSQLSKLSLLNYL